MSLRAIARAVAVGLAAFAALCPERSPAEVADVRKLPQQLAAPLDEVVVIAGRHVRLHLPPDAGNRHRSKNMAFLNSSQSRRAPPAHELSLTG